MWLKRFNGLIFLVGALTCALLLAACSEDDNPQPEFDWVALSSPVGEVPLYCAWGVSVDDLWAAGYSDSIFHFDGTRWSGTSIGEATATNAMWGSSSDDIFTVGSGGVIRHFQGSAWEELVLPPPPVNLWGVHGVEGDTVFAVGDSSLVVMFDGSRWSSISPQGYTYTFRDVWAFSGHDAFVGGGGLKS